MKHDSQHRVQDLDEGDADGCKLYNEHARGALWIHGEDTYSINKINQTDLEAIAINKQHQRQNRPFEPSPSIHLSNPAPPKSISSKRKLDIHSSGWKRRTKE